MLEDGFSFYIIWVDLVIVLWIGVCVAGLIGHNKCYQNLKQGNFYVVTDELIGKEEPETYPGIGFLNIFSKPAELKFYAYGSFTIASNHTSNDPDLYAKQFEYHG